jgi:hypothetical protein
MPSIETVRTRLTETIKPAEIDRLLILAETFDLATWIPGVPPTNAGSNRRFMRPLPCGPGSSIADSETSTTVLLSMAFR